MNRRTILATLDAHREALSQHGVRRLGLFGSYAAGTQTSGSDLDFVVDFEVKSFDAYMDVKFLLEKLFRRPVDLVLSDALKPGLRRSILREVLHLPGF